MQQSNSPTTLQHQHSGGMHSTGYPYDDRFKTTDINPLTMSEKTTLEKSDNNFIGGGHSFPPHETIVEQNQA